MRTYSGHGGLQDRPNDIWSGCTVAQARSGELSILVQYLNLEVARRRDVRCLACIDGEICPAVTWRYCVLLIACLLIWWLAVLQRHVV